MVPRSSELITLFLLFFRFQKKRKQFLEDLAETVVKFEERYQVSLVYSMQMIGEQDHSLLIPHGKLLETLSTKMSLKPYTDRCIDLIGNRTLVYAVT